MQYLSKSVIEEKLNAIDKVRDAILFNVLWETGARISEVLAIERSQIDFKDNSIKMIVLKRREKFEVVKPIKHSLMLSIKALNNNLKPSQKLLFDIQRAQAYKLSMKYFGMSPHKIRHSTAIDMVNQQIPIETIRRRLNHTSLSTTQKYLDYDDATMRKHLEMRK